MQQDFYKWRVVYQDDSHIDEDQAGSFANVDQSRVKRLELHPDGLADFIFHRVDIPTGAQAVFFRRRSTVINAQPDTPQPGTRTCIGWRRSEQDAVYMFVGADEKILLTSDLQGG